MPHLHVPPMPRVVPTRVFDAWGWCVSDVIEWRRPSDGPLARGASIDGANPPNLVFVVRAEAAPLTQRIGLPTELARLHAFGYGLGDELALAPYAIDDATDLLHAHGVPPRDVFWLAASSLDALVWGLHDWVHFHNHGPFDEPALTELQCDLVALAWLRANIGEIGLASTTESPTLREVAGELANLSRRRFEQEGLLVTSCDFDALFHEPYPSAPLAAVPFADPGQTARRG